MAVQDDSMPTLQEVQDLIAEMKSMKEKLEDLDFRLDTLEDRVWYPEGRDE